MTQTEEKPKPSFIRNFHNNIPQYLYYGKLIMELFRPMLQYLIINYAVNMLQTGINMLTPQFTGGIIDIVSRSKDEGELKELAIKMFIFTILNNEVSKFTGKLTSKYYTTFQRELKGEVYKRLLECDMEFFDKLSSAESTEIISSGVDELISFSIFQIASVLQTVLSIVGNLYFMFMFSPRLTLIALVVAPIKHFANFYDWQKNQEGYKEVGEIHTDLWNIPSQVFQNISLIKSFSTETKEATKYAELQKQLGIAQAKISQDSWFLSCVKSILNEGLDVFIIWIGGVMVFQGGLTAGQLSTFHMYSTQFSSYSLSIKSTFQSILSSAQRCGKMLNILEKHSKLNKEEGKKITKENLKGTISVKEVSFSYPAKAEVEVLTNINLEIKAGQATAFVGVSGSGKTTLTYLLQNLYRPTQGRIFIDGEDVRDYDIKWLHSHMGYVSQEPILLDRSIEENLVYGVEGPHSEELMEKTLTKSNSKFILNKEKFPKGLSSKLGSGQERTKLSGGQKQRIAIGRAFAKDPKILILDEPTSALDGESESKVQKAIDELTSMGDRTVIVVAHRLSTIINCQNIVVFEDGKVVEQGTHKELIAKDGAYKKLFEFQLESMRNL